jgi:predicted DNA-binding antitoxin AbrB/MazE fold protein
MSVEYKPGTRVKIIDRNPTPADAKSRLYFSHFRNLTGTVQRVFADGQEVQVIIDPESLPEEILQRHKAAEEAMRKRVEEAVSEEARERMGESATRVNLRYSVLVSPADLQPLEPDSSGAKKKSASAKTMPERTEKPEAGKAQAAHQTSADQQKSAKRITERELDLKEQELLQRKSASKKSK